MPKPSFVDSLGNVADLWLNKRTPIRLKTIEALEVSTGYSRSIIHRVLDNVFKELTLSRLLETVENEHIHVDQPSDDIVLHIAAGNVFTSWLPGAVLSLLAGFRCWIKPSTQEPVFARQWHESVRQVNAALAGRIAVVAWDDALLQEVRAVVAYGSDKTLQQIRQKICPGMIFVGYGHKISAAVVFKEARRNAAWWRAKIIRDCELFDLTGCLSPRILYIEGDHPRPFESLPNAVQRAPELRTFADPAEVVAGLSRFKGHLSAVGVAGPLHRLDAIRTNLEKLGVTRFCRIGDMQRPPLSWRNGGISLVEALNRSA